MHETALMQGVLDIVTEKLLENKLTRLKKIKLVVGEMSGAIPDALRFAFEASIAGTNYPEAELEIEEVRAEAECRLCKATFPYEPGMSCPECDGFAPRLIKGEELFIEYIDAE